MTPAVLLTGFEPFGVHATNPTERLVTDLHGATIGGLRVCGRVLPVSYERSLAELVDAVEQVRPSAVVCCGLDARASAVKVERLGVNLRSGDRADNDGRAARDEPVVLDGPDGLFATLPVRPIAEALQAGGIPAELSASAGTFVCNTVLYGLLHHMRRSADPVPAGFVHLPRSPEVAVRSPAPPPMALPRMRAAVELVIETVAAHLDLGRQRAAT